MAAAMQDRPSLPSPHNRALFSGAATDRSIPHPSGQTGCACSRSGSWTGMHQAAAPRLASICFAGSLKVCIDSRATQMLPLSTSASLLVSTNGRTDSPTLKEIAAVMGPLRKWTPGIGVLSVIASGIFVRYTECELCSLHQAGALPRRTARPPPFMDLRPVSLGSRGGPRRAKKFGPDPRGIFQNGL